MQCLASKVSDMHLLPAFSFRIKIMFVWTNLTFSVCIICWQDYHNHYQKKHYYRQLTSTSFPPKPFLGMPDSQLLAAQHSTNSRTRIPSSPGIIVKKKQKSLLLFIAGTWLLYPSSHTTRQSNWHLYLRSGDLLFRTTLHRAGTIM